MMRTPFTARSHVCQPMLPLHSDCGQTHTSCSHVGSANPAHLHCMQIAYAKFRPESNFAQIPTAPTRGLNYSIPIHTFHEHFLNIPSPHLAAAPLWALGKKLLACLSFGYAAVAVSVERCAREERCCCTRGRIVGGKRGWLALAAAVQTSILAAV
eukprot:1158491-Pelagomonas_calceolata.AAC.6